MTYRETLINEMIKSGINNCEVQDVFIDRIDRMDLIYNMADSLDYKYGDKLTMGPENAKKVALDNFRELCRYADSVEGTLEFAFFEGLISYVWEELLNVYKFEGITDELLNEVAMESVNENQFPAMDKTIGENIELCREYLKEIDNLLANIEVYNGEVEEVEG